jgi:hypothetical protein
MYAPGSIDARLRLFLRLINKTKDVYVDPNAETSIVVIDGLNSSMFDQIEANVIFRKQAVELD